MADFFRQFSSFTSTSAPFYTKKESGHKMYQKILKMYPNVPRFLLHNFDVLFQTENHFWKCNHLQNAGGPDSIFSEAIWEITSQKLYKNVSKYKGSRHNFLKGYLQDYIPNVVSIEFQYSFCSTTGTIIVYFFPFVTLSGENLFILG